MEGVLSRHRNIFNLGMVVTNTAFTSEAQWYVKPLNLYLRARDSEDVKRWIRGDFSSDLERREIPDAISLTSKLIVDLKRKK
jgi:hypothetical protein